MLYLFTLLSILNTVCWATTPVIAPDFSSIDQFGSSSQSVVDLGCPNGEEFKNLSLARFYGDSSWTVLAIDNQFPPDHLYHQRCTELALDTIWLMNGRQFAVSIFDIEFLKAEKKRTEIQTFTTDTFTNTTTLNSLFITQELKCLYQATIDYNQHTRPPANQQAYLCRFWLKKTKDHVFNANNP